MKVTENEGVMHLQHETTHTLHMQDLWKVLHPTILLNTTVLPPQHQHINKYMK